MAGDIITGPAIQQTQAKEVSAQEPPQRPNCQINHAGAGRSTNSLADKLVAEGHDLLQMSVDGFTAVMVQMATQLSDCAIHLQPFMHVASAPLRTPAPPQPRTAVRIPVPMPNPSPTIPTQPRHAKGGKPVQQLGLIKDAPDFLAQLCR